MPKKQHCTNLLVAVCLSASRIMYGSIRMEPVLMILDESTANKAFLTIDAKIPMQDVDYMQLKAELIRQKQQFF